MCVNTNSLHLLPYSRKYRDSPHRNCYIVRTNNLTVPATNFIHPYSISSLNPRLKITKWRSWYNLLPNNVIRLQLCGRCTHLNHDTKKGHNFYLLLCATTTVADSHFHLYIICKRKARKHTNTYWMERKEKSKIYTHHKSGNVYIFFCKC